MKQKNRISVSDYTLMLPSKALWTGGQAVDSTLAVHTRMPARLELEDSRWPRAEPLLAVCSHIGKRAGGGVGSPPDHGPALVAQLHPTGPFSKCHLTRRRASAEHFIFNITARAQEVQPRKLSARSPASEMCSTAILNE